MIQRKPNYKSATGVATLERWGAPLVWIIAAALFGWAIALFLGALGDRELAKLPVWKPTPIAMDLKPRQPVATTPATTSSNAPWQLVGIAEDRVYVRSNNKPASFAEGETLPNGDVIKKIEKDALVVSSGGKETRIALFKSANADAAKSAATTSDATATVQRAACRLSAQDKAQATWIEPAVAAALSKEQATFTRIFVPLVGTGGGAIVGGTPGGVRAQGTGGTTAMFGIQDGDTLLRADGKAIVSGLNVISDVIAKTAGGEAVVVEGERAGAPKRWVFAAASCRN